MAEQRIKELKEKTLGVDRLQEKYEFVQMIISYLESRKNQIIEEIRKTFNKQVTELYEKLGFKKWGYEFRIDLV